MSAEVFLDTNIFVYHVDDSDPRKLQIASSIVLDAVRAGNACISTQVIQEWITVVLRKSSTDLSISDIRRYVARTLVPMVVPLDVPRLYDLALSIHERYAFHFYDALIVAAAIEAGCKELYSEDLQHGQRIDSLTIVNPFPY